MAQEMVGKIERLRALINQYHGTWDERVTKFANDAGRTRSTVYRWLTDGPPDLILECMEYRLGREAES